MYLKESENLKLELLGFLFRIIRLVCQRVFAYKKMFLADLSFDNFSIYLDKSNEESYVKLNLKDQKFVQGENCNLDNLLVSIEENFFKAVKKEEKFFKK